MKSHKEDSLEKSAAKQHEISQGNLIGVKKHEISLVNLIRTLCSQKHELSKGNLIRKFSQRPKKACVVTMGHGSTVNSRASTPPLYHLYSTSAPPTPNPTPD
jgi:hypothetical protein